VQKFNSFLQSMMKLLKHMALMKVAVTSFSSLELQGLMVTTLTKLEGWKVQPIVILPPNVTSVSLITSMEIW
jgi:hypothetical protein